MTQTRRIPTANPGLIADLQSLRRREFRPIDLLDVNFQPGQHRSFVGDAQIDLTAVCAHLVYLCHGSSYLAGWYHDPQTGVLKAVNVGEKLMLIVSEVAEAMEADRKSLMDDKLTDRPGIEVELADAAIRIFDLAGCLDLDLGGAIAAKLKFNATRPDHKPANRAAGGKAY